MATTLSDLSNDLLADEITTWAARVAAGEARLLELVAEYDAREAWGGPGMLSCAHWLSWRLGIGLNAAREKVRVARRLRDLPKLAAAFAAGTLSWSQVRAITRVNGLLSEHDWIHYARCMSGQHLERLVQAVNGAAREERVAAEIREERQQEAGPVAEEVPVPRPAEPAVRDWGAVTPEERAAMKRWHEECKEADRHNKEIAPAMAAYKASRQDVTLNHALLRLATAALDAPGVLPLEVKERLRVNVDPVSGWARAKDGALIAPGRVAKCAGPFVPLDLTAFDLGRTSRLVSLPLRRLLGDVDGERCRFPGCSRVAKLHAHHVWYWSQGGPTDLANPVHREAALFRRVSRRRGTARCHG